MFTTIPSMALSLLFSCAGAPPSPPSAQAAASTHKAADGLPDAVKAHWAQISATARRHGVDPQLVAVIVWTESAGKAKARSPIGARGLMQLMPATAAEVARDLGRPVPTADDLDEPALNLELGVAHVADLLAELTDGPLDRAAVHRVAAAYNGGLQVALRAEAGAPLPPQTSRYAARVADRWVARRRVTK